MNLAGNIHAILDNARVPGRAAGTGGMNPADHGILENGNQKRVKGIVEPGLNVFDPAFLGLKVATRARISWL